MVRGHVQGFMIGAVLLGTLFIAGHSFFFGSGIESNIITSYQGATCTEGEILIRFRPDIDRAAIRTFMLSSQVQDLEVIPGIDVHRLKILSGSSLPDKLAVLSRDSRVEFAEPNYCLHLASTIPNDPYFRFQWAMQNTGQPIAPPAFYLPSGTAGADIKASEAWDVFQGTTATIVGVVDTGVDLTHPDLINHIVSSGLDFPNNDDVAQDDHGHGTHVAGTIGAEGNNGLGVSGVNWNVQILPIKVFDEGALGKTSWVANGIIYAASHGARVINMSLGGSDVVVNQTLELAIKYAYDRNVVMVAAAGNDGLAGVWYPAAYNPYVLAAAATDQNDQRVTLDSTDGLFGSNYGPEVDVAAPGIDILSTWGIGLYKRGHPGFQGYVYNWGTSSSTAFVSGLAALLISFQPELSNSDVMAIIKFSADDVNFATLPGRDDYLGYGRINASRALMLAYYWSFFRGRIGGLAFPAGL